MTTVKGAVKESVNVPRNKGQMSQLGATDPKEVVLTSKPTMLINIKTSWKRRSPVVTPELV